MSICNMRIKWELIWLESTLKIILSYIQHCISSYQSSSTSISFVNSGKYCRFTNPSKYSQGMMEFFVIVLLVSSECITCLIVQCPWRPFLYLIIMIKQFSKIFCCLFSKLMLCNSDINSMSFFDFIFLETTSANVKPINNSTEKFLLLSFQISFKIKYPDGDAFIFNWRFHMIEEHRVNGLHLT